MKLFGLNITRAERKSGSSPEEIRSLLESMQGGAAKSGANVTWKTALEVSTAFACARVIAEGLAQVPFKLFRETADGGREPAKEHSAYRLMTRRPNEWQTSYEFREMIALHLVFCGGAYVWKNSVRGQIVELLPYQPQQVTVKRDGWAISYEVTTDKGQRIAIPQRDMWHMRGPSWDGVTGLEAVRLARESLGLALAAEEHSARGFGNGASVGGVLTTDKDLKEDQRRELRESWEKSYGGLSNAFKTAILWGGLKWIPRAQQNDQAQLVEQRRFQVEEICRAFRVMPIMVGYSDKTATYASAEQMFLAHVVHTLGPWYARIEQSAESALLTEEEIEQGYYFKFVANGLMRGAHKDRAAYFAKALGAGGSPAWMTQDEVRGLEELNPMNGAASELPVAVNVPPQPPEDKTAEVLIEMKTFAQQFATSIATSRGDTHINVGAPTINSKGSDVHNHLPEPVVQMEANITTPETVVHVDNHVKAGDTNVEVLPAPAPEIKVVNNVAPADISRVEIVGMPQRSTESRVERDGNGNIIKTTQLETDA